MTSNQQNLIALAIILLVALAIGWMGQKPPMTPQGLLTLKGNGVTTNNHYSLQEVRVYEVMPPGGKVVGELTAELAFDPDANVQQQVQELVDYARARAGTVGANAVIVEMVAPRGFMIYLAAKIVKI